MHFHATAFHRIKPGGPGPVLGELVEVGERTSSKAGPRTNRVSRRTEPVLLTGTIKSYDSQKGWGFVEFGDGQLAFLHSSDLSEGWLPVIGTGVQFYPGSKRERSRACWARPVLDSTTLALKGVL